MPNPSLPANPEETHGHRHLLVLFVLGFSSLCASLMQSLVIPVQSKLPELLDTSAANASWVVTATLLGSAVAMPVAGRLADIVGKKTVLIFTAALMLVGSVLCAASGIVEAIEFETVIVGRVLQGFAMGYIPVAISMVREVTPHRLVNSATAAISATLGVGGALGLPLAAWMVQQFSWNMLFWLAAVLALCMVVFSAALLPNIAAAPSGRFDIVGSLGLAAGLVGLLVGITKGNEWGWAAPGTLSLIVGGVLILVVWGVFELRHKAPLVDLRTTARLPILFTNLAALLVGFGMMAQTIVVPQLLQIPESTGFGLGQTMLQTGMWMAPAGLMMLLFSPISGSMLTRFGGRTTLVVGALVIACGYLVGAFFSSAPWQLMVANCVASAGVGIAYAAMPTLILSNVPRSEAASSVGVNALMRSMGSAVAGAVMAIVLTSNLGPDGTTVQWGFQLCFFIGAGAALAGAALTLCVPRQSVRA